jgi:hypothetical protein
MGTSVNKSEVMRLIDLVFGFIFVERLGLGLAVLRDSILLHDLGKTNSGRS